MSLYNDHFNEVLDGMEKTASAENTDIQGFIKLACDVQGKIAARGWVEGMLKKASAGATPGAIRIRPQVQKPVIRNRPVVQSAVL
jgi:hypothetical protein